MNTVKTLFLFPNGEVAGFDAQDDRIKELDPGNLLLDGIRARGVECADLLEVVLRGAGAGVINTVGVRREKPAREDGSIDDLASCVRRLRMLLDDPHPELATWQATVQSEIRAIAAFAR